MIIKCNCDGYLSSKTGAIYQDNQYGKNMRAHNPLVKEPKGSHWKCTVCGTEHTKSGSDRDNNNDESKKKSKQNTK